MKNQPEPLKTYKNRHETIKNQSRTIKTNPGLYRVVRGGSGGYRRLPGGIDDYSLQTHTHCNIIYISSLAAFGGQDFLTSGGPLDHRLSSHTGPD